MPVRYSGPVAVPTVPTTLYTAPQNQFSIEVIRQIRVVNTTSAAINFTMSIGADAPGTRIYPAMSIPANGDLDNSGCYFPVYPGEIVQAYASAPGLTVTLAGGAS